MTDISGMIDDLMAETARISARDAKYSPLFIAFTSIAIGIIIGTNL